MFNQERCDIYHDFLGFVDIYTSLSLIIPQHFTVVDLGCAYSPQCFLFDSHKKYVGVDVFSGERFISSNCEQFVMDILEFCKKYIDSFDVAETFAICSYVPSWSQDNLAVVRSYFTNVFTFYPSNKGNREHPVRRSMEGV